MYDDINDDDVLDAYLPAGLSRTPVRPPVTPVVTPVSVCKKINSSTPSTPTAHFGSDSTQSRSYAQRTRSKDVCFRYNCKETTDWGAPISQEWNLEPNPFEVPIFKSGFKYMFQRTSDLSRTMDNMIEDLSASITEYYKLEENQNLKDTSAEDVNYVGRIRCDGKLSAGSTFFEGTRDRSDGRIVTLDLAQLEEYFLFPGQVLALSGKNNLGKCVAVSKVFSPRPLPFPDMPIKINHSTGPLRILVAAGPYSTRESLSAEPLDDFLKEIQRSKPHFCIMIGPFVDASHPMIETAQVSETFEEMFNRQMTYLSDEVEKIDSNCRILLVSTSKDAHHHPVYPTPPYSLKLKNITALPDPAMISIGGVLIGITSQDILKHLGANELSQSTITSDRMGRIARHLLCQRSFYPLYPPDESVSLDIVHLVANGQMGCTPHVLILPSDLRHFIKDVDGTVVVNPERLTKGLSGGTFAKLQIDLSDDFGGPIADFVMGEIIKI